MSWDDDWRERDRQEKEEAYDRWYAEKEAEADARAGRYDRPTYSETAWDAYEPKWQEVDREERWQASERERREVMRGSVRSKLKVGTTMTESKCTTTMIIVRLRPVLLSPSGLCQDVHLTLSRQLPHEHGELTMRNGYRL